MAASFLLFFHQSPAHFLDAAFGCLDSEQLNALLELRIAHGIGLTLVVVQGELIFRSRGVGPFGAAATGYEQDNRKGKQETCTKNHGCLMCGGPWGCGPAIAR